jgi:enoyl-CoA hydratase/carnithine racemase
MVLACQFRIMTADPRARIGLPELNLGLIPAWGGTQRLSRLVGRSNAMDMILFGKKIAASRALEIGLVNSLAEPDQLMPCALEFAQKLSELPPIAVSYVLRATAAGIYEGVDRALEVESEGGAAVRNSADFKEGLEAFMQKRKPVFRGR